MKRNYFASLLLLLLLSPGLACTESEKKSAAGHHEEELSAEVCKLTGSVNEEVLASAEVVYADSGSRIFEMEWQGRIAYDTRQQSTLSSRVAGRLERLQVRFDFQPVKKGELIMEVYSPDLVAAQRELLFLAREDQPSLKQSAIQKLRYLGMSQGQIDRVLASKTPLYKVGVYSPVSGFIADSRDVREGQYVAAGESLFSIYRNNQVVAEFSLNRQEAVGVQTGQQILFHGSANEQELYRGQVGLIEPTVRNGESFSTVRVYLPAGEFVIGELVQATVPLFLDKGWWLPESALVDLGGESVVFVRKDEMFVPEKVETGRRLSGLVQVMSPIGDFAVARQAAYLVDSESFIDFKKDL